MIITPCGASEGWCRVVEIRFNDNHITFFMFATELGYEEEVSDLIKGRLDLEDELYERSYSCVSCVIVTVE